MLLLLCSAACGINLAAESTEAPPASMAEEMPTESNASSLPSAPSGPTPSLEPNLDNPNATGGNDVLSPNATAVAPVESGLLVGAYDLHAIAVNANTPADGTPLPIAGYLGLDLAVFSFYNGKLFAPGGCLSRQHSKGGYLVLRPCDDANVSVWGNYGAKIYSHSANNPNYDDWVEAPCPGVASSKTCYLSQARGRDQNVLTAAIMRDPPPAGLQGVLIHLAADPNRCLADVGSATPRVVPCNAASPGQHWLVNAFGAPLRIFSPFRSWRNRCIERPTEAAAAKLVNCNLASAKNYNWFVQEPGHLGTGGGSGPSGRLYLVYDGATDVVSFSELTGTYAKTPPVWGFGPYPRQLQK